MTDLTGLFKTYATHADFVAERNLAIKQAENQPLLDGIKGAEA